MNDYWKRCSCCGKRFWSKSSILHPCDKCRENLPVEQMESLSECVNKALKRNKNKGGDERE